MNKSNGIDVQIKTIEGNEIGKILDVMCPKDTEELTDSLIEELSLKKGMMHKSDLMCMKEYGFRYCRKTNSFFSEPIFENFDLL